MPRLGERRTLRNGAVVEFRYPTLADGSTGSKLVPVFIKGSTSRKSSKKSSKKSSRKSGGSRKLSMSSARKLMKEYSKTDVLTPTAKARILSRYRKSTKKYQGGSRKRSDVSSSVRPVSLQEAVNLLRKYYTERSS